MASKCKKRGYVFIKVLQPKKTEPVAGQDGHILVIDDDPEVLLSAEMLLEDHFGRVQALAHPGGLMEILSGEAIDVILLDMNFTGGSHDGQEGLAWLEKIKSRCPGISVVIITAYGDIDLAVKATKRGAFDFVLKPWKNARLLATVFSAFKYARSVRQNERLQSTQQVLQADGHQHFDRLIGQSRMMQKLRENLEKISPTEANVLIQIGRAHV